MIENSKITFREMRKDDLDSVMVIDHLSFQMPWPESAYRHDLMNNANAILWVAEKHSDDKGGIVVGMIDVWLVQEEAHIATLAIHPDYRGHGIAAGLLRKVLFESFQLGARRAMLEVRASNHAAQTLYKDFGFKVVSRRRRYYRDNNEDALLMNLDNLEELVYRKDEISAERTDNNQKLSDVNSVWRGEE
ncbi:MAG: ribosomal protein S18-alanine N-acetyltransferase [Chloroflexota bacterium]|nr:MAG: ribosomal protein S18-alanine N-acetyltransferase [Chloroflexota bacterium]